MRVFDFIDLDGGKKPLLSGHVNQSGGTFEFVINKTASYKGTTVTVPVDSKGYWKWNNEQDYVITKLFRMIYYNTLITDVSFGKDFDTSKVTDMEDMLAGCSNLTSVRGIENWNTSKVTSMNSIFYNCSKLTTLNLTNWNTGNVTSMYNMFGGCSKLTTVGDLSNWNTSKVTTIQNMFNNCSALTYLKLDNWTTTQITTSSYYSNFVPNVSTLTIDYKPSQWNSAIPAKFSFVNWNSVE